MRKLKDFTIEEFKEYKEALTPNKIDVFYIFELFGEKAMDLPYDEFEKKLTIIKNQTIPKNNKIKKIYKIGNRKFKVTLNPTKITAGQFIDFQTYMEMGGELQNILSVFLTPSYKKFGITRFRKYNNGYDPVELQDYLFKNCKIEVAQEISDFFLSISEKLLKTMRDYSRSQKARMKYSREIRLFGYKVWTLWPT